VTIYTSIQNTARFASMKVKTLLDSNEIYSHTFVSRVESFSVNTMVRQIT